MSHLFPDATACIGLISDTHMPQRLDALPAVLADLFRDVDLVLHAGDVGELWVLDRLSAMTSAPIFAVHGNDESADAQREYPYQQVIYAAGTRIALTHAHYPDYVTEMESRKDDNWLPKLAHRATFGKRAGAPIVVFGHTHIPMVTEFDGVTLINPGALASGSALTRQTRKTVARLYLFESRPPEVEFIDLANPDVQYTPQIDFSAGFKAALDQFSGTLIDPDFQPIWSPMETLIRSLYMTQRNAFNAIHEPILSVSRRCWSGEQNTITREDMIAVLRGLNKDRRVPVDVLSQLHAMVGV
jgi:uncharacterized protein